VYAYDYDALGNVGNLYVYVEDLKGYGGSNGWKRMRYEYDLVSKKVKYVGYQEGQSDQWLHRYRYDGMNRLVEVQTSRDGWYWERDAWYKYYLHRVLGRVMLGERLVQVLDKVYTINGWVKGENAWRLDSVLDLGQDGRMGGMYQYVAKDVMGYELKYFSGDYKAVGLYNTNAFSNFVSLYNGNIAMSVLQQDTMEVMGRRYRYDALNRLKSVDALMGVGFTAFGGYRERFSYDRDGNITRLTRYAKASVMDSLKYNYYAGNNRLEYVNDVVSASSFTNDIDNQGVGNYKYDRTGNLVEDVSESTRIHWTYYNKVKQIDSVKLIPPKYGLVWATKLRMKYDALGNRIVKENPKHKIKEVYVRDAQGNILALYQVKGDSLYTKEFYMYGSQRLGYLEDGVFLGRKCIGKWCNVLTPVLPMFPSTLSNSVGVVLGKKRYELNDWLGNVRVVINDRKTPVNSGNATVGYKAQVVNVSDYYSFGSEIAERSYDPVKPFYRFGFNTQEKTFELNRDHYTAKFWEYDARLGRRWNVDPKPTVGESEYAVNKNNPVLNNDPNGDCPICPYLVGAAVGAAIDAGIQLYDIATDDKKTLKDFSFTSVATSAAIGATGEWVFRLVKPTITPFVSKFVSNTFKESDKIKWYYRYVGKEEAEDIMKKGIITTEGKHEGKIYFTDRYYKTAGRAKTHLQLPKKPSYRVKIDPKDVKHHTPFKKVYEYKQYGKGGGTEATTTEPIKVNPKHIEKLKGAPEK
jgi:hypothetical protein